MTRSEFDLTMKALKATRAKATKSKEAALEFLVRAEILNTDGTLHEKLQ